jgi:DNA-binding beta-propeller fold protein YncE
LQGDGVFVTPFATQNRWLALGSGFKNPFHVTINRANTQVYVTDPGNENVQVLSYPDGANIATLGKSDGVKFPLGAVDSQNFVP